MPAILTGLFALAESAVVATATAVAGLIVGSAAVILGSSMCGGAKPKKEGK